MTADDKSVENLLRALRSEPEAAAAARAERDAQRRAFTFDETVHSLRTGDLGFGVRRVGKQRRWLENGVEHWTVPVRFSMDDLRPPPAPVAHQRANRDAAIAEYLRGYQDALDGRTANP